MLCIVCPPLIRLRKHRRDRDPFDSAQGKLFDCAKGFVPNPFASLKMTGAACGWC